MNTKRLRELCDAAEAGSAKIEDLAELVVLGREAARVARSCAYVVRRGGYYLVPNSSPKNCDATLLQAQGRMSKKAAKRLVAMLKARHGWQSNPPVIKRLRRK